MDKNFAFLGTGWSFPPEFDFETGQVKLVSDSTDINQSLQILLSTTLGERVMQPQYGCNIADYLFDGLDNTLIGYIKDRVKNAILFYEPRIAVESITVTDPDSPDLLRGRFDITIVYIIPETNSRFNYVYNFYENEAMRPL
jgi:phage baseplate assembly protein W